MILVTGATGNVGGELVRALAGAGEEVRALIRRDSDRSRLPEMRRAGVERIALQSSSAAPDGDLSNAIARYHILSERAVRESGLAWTFLQPNSFMSNALRWAPQLEAGNVVRDAFGDVPIPTIHPYDVAAVSSAAL